jgi:3-oxoacyl-[acyl-carrier protein] reductase
MNAQSEKRVVLVTGASRGLGKEIALRFGRAGDVVLVNYLRNENDARAVVRAIQDGNGTADILHADVSKSRDVSAMFAIVREQFGRIDVLVNNAGIVRDRLLLRMSEADWDEVLNVNLSAGFYCIREAAGLMKQQGGGHIIAVSSIIGVQGREGQANYSAAKAGLIGLTRAAARELGEFNIRVNAILPGYLRTSLTTAAADAVYDRAVRENVLNRISDLQEVAEFIYHLSFMKNVSGQVFNLDSRIV